jgi:hypothetical protein
LAHTSIAARIALRITRSKSCPSVLVGIGIDVRVAKIKYIPPKQTVEFTTTPTDNAPVQVRVDPDPISAEITAEWDTP